MFKLEKTAVNEGRKLATLFVAFVAVLCGLAVADPVQDGTISGNYTLTADEDWSAAGKLTFANGARVNLNGHNLTIGEFDGEFDGAELATTNDIAVGYAGLSHLDTDGGQRVALSGYSLAADDRVEMRVRFLSPTPAEQFLFGSRASALSRAFNLFVNNLAMRIDYNNKQIWFGQYFNAADDYTIVMDGGMHVFSVLSDGVQVKPSVTMPDASFDAVNPFSLFTVNSSSLGAKVRFYWFRAYGSDGSLKCNAVPAYDKAAGEIGVYDLVGGNFYGNNGTGVFTAKGEAQAHIVNIDAVEGYSRLDYLETDGSSYAVLSDYSPSADDRVEISVRFLDRRQQFLFGSRVAAVNRAFNLYLDNNTPRIDYSNRQPGFGQELTTADDYKIVMDGGALSFTVQYPGGLTLGSKIAIPNPNPFEPLVPFYLFTVNTGGTATSLMSKVRFYRFKAYGRNGALKSDVVPAKRTSDGAIGLYDRVAKAFYMKSGNGNFNAVGAGETALSNVVDPAELHINVATDTVFTNDFVKLDENVKLVKEGPGKFVAEMANQRYTGGTLVKDGTFVCGGNGNGCILGADGSEVVVSATGDFCGTLEMNGKILFANYNFVLDGGRIVNSVDTGTGSSLPLKSMIASLALSTDSCLVTDGQRYGMVRLTNGNAGDYGIAKTTLDLGGHTLTIESDGGFVTRGLTTSGGAAGTIRVTGSQNFSFYPPESDMSNATLIIDDKAMLRVIGSNKAIPTVKDYIVNTMGEDDYGNPSQLFGPVIVKGTFQPNTDHFYGSRLMSGATLDLSGRTTPLDLRSVDNPSAGVNVRNVQFEDNAIITVRMGDARIRNPVVKWANADDKPANWDGLTFELEKGPAGGYLVKKDDGLYFNTKSLIIVVR